MAKISLGIWTTHGPTLNTTAEEWMLRAPPDRERMNWYRGQQKSFDDLVSMRRDENLEEVFTLDERRRRRELCEEGINRLAEFWAANRPDVAVIFGNDQRELILDNLQPMFSLYHGDTFWQKPLTQERAEQLPPGIRETEWAYRPEEPVVWPALPNLAAHVFEQAQEVGFDLAAIKSWPDMPEDHFHIGTPHAFSWIIRRVMKDDPVPILPVFTNTFFPPNQPTAKRCFEFGQFIGNAIRSWKEDLTVGVFGSGGLTHFVIDEEEDQRLLNAVQARDAAYVQSIPQSILQAGTSEYRNWIAGCGALFDTDLSGEVFGYVPCYRSEAGTGTANGFIGWN